jgi:hypothetical protein
MKKHFFTAAFAFIAFYGYSQGPNTFPATGNVGIGTSTPGTHLEVVYAATASPASPVNHAYFGSAITTVSIPQTVAYNGLYVRDTQNTILLESSYSKGNKGYIEFNPLQTTNTTRSAVSIGYNRNEYFRVNQDGKVRIGSAFSDIKTPAGYRLFVEDGILTEKVKVAVKTTANWADYVFADEYKLMPLSEVEKFTKENKHLPNVPSAEEMVANGLDVAQTNAKLLEKIEELTLYTIEQNKVNEKQSKEIEELKAMVKTLAERK